jgi:hypothetical protein
MFSNDVLDATNGFFVRVSPAGLQEVFEGLGQYPDAASKVVFIFIFFLHHTP